MDKRKAGYETLMIVASNLTIAEMSATRIPGTSLTGDPEKRVVEVFHRHLARLEELHEQAE